AVAGVVANHVAVALRVDRNTLGAAKAATAGLERGVNHDWIDDEGLRRLIGTDTEAHFTPSAERKTARDFTPLSADVLVKPRPALAQRAGSGFQHEVTAR